MFSICENYFSEHKINISTNPDIQKSKTKCMVFSTSRNMEEPAPIMLGQSPLPWVDSWPHLGHEISTENLSRPFNSSLDEDAKAKLRRFIGKYDSLRQEFGFLQPDKFFEIINIYATSFYGSNLWLFSGNNKVFSNWSKMIKLNWGLPWAAHKYFLEEVSQSTCLLYTSDAADE